MARTALGDGVGLVTSVFWTRLTKLFVAFDFKKMCIKRGIDLKELNYAKVYDHTVQLAHLYPT